VLSIKSELPNGKSEDAYAKGMSDLALEASVPGSLAARPWNAGAATADQVSWAKQSEVQMMTHHQQLSREKLLY
jgi:hypothetical protein